MKAKINIDGIWLPEVEIKSQQFSLNERFKRGFKTFSIFFAAAIFSVLIPVLHFLLVPIFLILSFFLAHRKFNETHSLDLTDFKCPGCKENLKAGKIGINENDLVVRLRCNNCRKNSIITLNN